MRQICWRIGCLVYFLVMPLGASATLGEAPFLAGASATVDARVANYQPVQIFQGYRVMGIEFNNGTVVREFVDSGGRVFALRWSGPDLPDMGMLLGSYLPVFKASVQAARQAGKRGGPVVVQSGGLVLVSTGGMGAFQGHAYLEALSPPGVDAQALLK
jgi:hypothetical protein